MGTKLHSCRPSAADKETGGRLASFPNDIPLLTEGVLSLERLMRYAVSPKYGAVVTFSGCVRDTEDGLPISAITYEIYKEMAEREIKKIIRRSEERWGGAAFLQHRIGAVPAGEASLVVVCASVHRKEAFEACQYIIDEIKAGVPIWKIEFK